MSQTPEAFTRERLQTLESKCRSTKRRQTRLVAANSVLAVLASTAAVRLAHHQISFWFLVVPLLLFAAIAGPLFRGRRELHRLARLTALYDAALARLTHQAPEQPQHGEAFREHDHLFDRDLNVLGPDSLFQLLATTRTGLGQRALAATLLSPPALGASRSRQTTIRELTPKTELREQIALLGPSAFAATPHETFDRWLDEPATTFPSLLRPVFYLASTIVVGLGLAWATNHLSTATLLPNLAAILGLQAAVALLYRGRVLPILEATEPLPAQLQILRDGLKLMPHPDAAVDKALSELQNQVFLVEQRKTEWCYLPCLLFNVGTQAAIRINRWKMEHGPAMREWIATWAEFDAVNALAQYAFEHPENSYPELLDEDHAALFEATGLTHPLLPGAVANDVSLTEENRFYLISGSNMAGKSTLLRSIGLAVVLGRTGAPIPAGRARMTPLAVGASLTPMDSLAEGKSRFLAEVQRLKQILTAARQAPALFLIDELLSGTNSADRLTAASGVLDALLAAGAMGALSTHDLALTTLVTEENAGRNVHMASPDAGDPLGFDYLLKPGINTTTNALAFLRLLDLG